MPAKQKQIVTNHKQTRNQHNNHTPPSTSVHPAQQAKSDPNTHNTTNKRNLGAKRNPNNKTNTQNHEPIRQSKRNRTPRHNKGFCRQQKKITATHQTHRTNSKFQTKQVQQANPPTYCIKLQINNEIRNLNSTNTYYNSGIHIIQSRTTQQPQSLAN